MVHVKKEFNVAPISKLIGKSQPNVVNPEIILSKGEDSAVTGFYDFGGNFNAQQRRGVVWLTAFQNKENENAQRPKLAKVGDDIFVALWECWTSTRFVTTQYIVLNTRGERLKDMTDLGGVRLSRGDDVAVANGKVVWTTGDRTTGKLRVYTLDPRLSKN